MVVVAPPGSVSAPHGLLIGNGNDGDSQHQIADIAETWNTSCDGLRGRLHCSIAVLVAIAVDGAWCSQQENSM